MAKAGGQKPNFNQVVARGMQQPVRVWPLLLVGGGITAALTLYNSIFTVNGGHCAIVFNKISGTRPDVYGEGTKLKVPWIEDPVFFDIRAQGSNIRSPTGSKDLQMINVSLRILSRPDPRYLPKIYVTLGEDYSTRVLPSIVNEVSKAVVAQYTASELLTRRDAISTEIKSALTSRAQDFHIIIDEVNLVDLGFGKEFRAAVEAKKVAQQDAERARFLVVQAKEEKRSAIIKALGEARSIELLGEASENNPNFLRLRRLEAIREIASTLSASRNRILLDSSNLMFNSLSEEIHNSEVSRAPSANSAFHDLYESLSAQYVENFEEEDSRN